MKVPFQKYRILQHLCTFRGRKKVVISSFPDFKGKVQVTAIYTPPIYPLNCWDILTISLDARTTSELIFLSFTRCFCFLFQPCNPYHLIYDNRKSQYNQAPPRSYPVLLANKNFLSRKTVLNTSPIQNSDHRTLSWYWCNSPGISRLIHCPGSLETV